MYKWRLKGKGGIRKARRIPLAKQINVEIGAEVFHE